MWLNVGSTGSGGQYTSVKDTGSGILEGEIPIVLASFGQGSNSIKSTGQGAGLGLLIAKNLIDLHGGAISLKSKLRSGAGVIVAFPPERVMSGLAPIANGAPPHNRPNCAKKPLFGGPATFMVARFSGLGAMGNAIVEISCALLGATPAAARFGGERRRSANETNGWLSASVCIAARVSGPPAAPAS